MQLLLVAGLIERQETNGRSNTTYTDLAKRRRKAPVNGPVVRARGTYKHALLLGRVEAVLRPQPSVNGNERGVTDI